MAGGAEIEYEGEPGSALEPVNDAARQAKAKLQERCQWQQPAPKSSTMSDDGELDKLREEYELLFNEKPHHNAKAETLREKIADKRKELGVSLANQTRASAPLLQEHRNLWPL